MKKPDSLIQMVGSLSRQEKKAFSVSSAARKDSDYVKLFSLIDRNPSIQPSELRSLFAAQCPDGSFNRSAEYLYDRLLDVMVETRKKSDPNFILQNMILQARTLCEKSMFSEALALIGKIKRDSEHYSNGYALLMAQRLELDYNLVLGFEDIDEKELSQKHAQVRTTLKNLFRLNEQASVYELLRHRISRQGSMRSAADLHYFDDLVTSELSIISSMRNENFEIKKNHKLFQAYYFISVGNYLSARNQFMELNELFESHPHLWCNPPVYYLSVLEGILDSLRVIRDYEGIEFFLGKLRRLSEVYTASSFRLTLDYDIYIYRLWALMDSGRFEETLGLVEESRDSLLERIDLLRENQQAEITLYTALAYIGNNDFKKARRMLNPYINKVMRTNSRTLWRTIRIANMMIYFELNDSDYVSSLRRSIMREISKKNYRGLKVEMLMLRFMDSFVGMKSLRSRKAYWAKIEPELERMRSDRYESQILRMFDFTLWIKAKILDKPLAEIMREDYMRNNPGKK